MNTYPNVYADFAYVLTNKTATRNLIHYLQTDDLIRDRTLFGSDFWVVNKAGQLKENQERFLKSRWQGWSGRRSDGLTVRLANFRPLFICPIYMVHCPIFQRCSEMKRAWWVNDVTAAIVRFLINQNSEAGTNIAKRRPSKRRRQNEWSVLGRSCAKLWKKSKLSKTRFSYTVLNKPEQIEL